LAHNVQLVIKDGLKLNNDFERLINHVSKDIVSKSKCSLVIAEELRQFNKKLNKQNVTRWNSVLFMIRSVLKLKPEEMKKMRQEMPTKTSEPREIKSKFDLSYIDRLKLQVLKDLLEMFEFVTDELQSNRINISRVYPAITFLSNKFEEDDENKFEYTRTIRKEMLLSLNKGFKDLIKEDVFIVSTFLDPNFGLNYFETNKQEEAKARLLSLLKTDLAVKHVI
jgi:hypothetical protein